MNSFFKSIQFQTRTARYFWLAVVLLAFIFGWMLSSGGETPNHYHDLETPVASVWTCSMHPQIQQPKPGKCPICGMDLIPLTPKSGGDENPRQITFSANAQKLAEIETFPVKRQFVEHNIRMVGKIEVDETRLAYITAWIPGRIDRLYVNYTGSTVKKGDHLVELFSPELLTTRQELVESLKALESIETSSYSEMKETARRQLASVKERLRLWGLSNEQIQNMEKNETSSDHITLYSPLSGVVVDKNALEGTYVETGAHIYTIANLSKVWVIMDAYESDLTWLHYGQEVEFSTEAYPDAMFRGRISFIDPLLDPATRTVKIRVNLANPNGILKPEMFVRAVVRSRIAEGGKIMDPGLAGKWICSMHPEVIKNSSGKCDVCEMPLVRAEELGFVSATNAAKNVPLTIPATSPLITGKRAIVYVTVPGKPGVYEGREIELGPRAGDFYLVKSGLQEGDQVVVKGNFKIDSAIQIQAGPSMMNPQGGGSAPAHQHGGIPPKNSAETTALISTKKMDTKHLTDISQKFLSQLDAVYRDYFAIQNALSHDNFNSLKEQSDALIKHLAAVQMELLEGDAHMVWMDILPELKNASEQIKGAADLKTARVVFEKLSIATIYTAKTFGSTSLHLLVYHCPMAFNNKGADWLQNKSGPENPYFGRAMFSCGSQTADLSKSQKVSDQGGHQHE